MPFRPLGDRVVVRVNKPETKVGSLVIPESVAESEQTRTGVVVAAGPGRFTKNGDLIPMAVPVNATVLFNKHAGISVRVPSSDEPDGVEVLVLREDEVLGWLDWTPTELTPGLVP